MENVGETRRSFRGKCNLLDFQAAEPEAWEVLELAAQVDRLAHHYCGTHRPTSPCLKLFTGYTYCWECSKAAASCLF